MRKWTVTLAAVAAATCALVAPALASADDPPLFWHACDGNQPDEGAGQCFVPTGVAVDPATGAVYVTDYVNDRVQEFTVWGLFVRAFGWDVAPDGAPGDTAEDRLETCTDQCQAGDRGDGPGQLMGPSGIAVNSHGDVVVVDDQANRIQSFSTDGSDVQFGWAVGKGVEQGPVNPGDRCTASDVEAGDQCGSGSTGTGPSQFSGDWPIRRTFLAVGPDDEIYVGDRDRIQTFDASGAHQRDIPLPEPGIVGALAADPSSGDLYFSYASSIDWGYANQPDVYRLDPVAGTVEDSLSIRIPIAIAVDTKGGVHVYDDQSYTGTGSYGSPPNHEARILRFDSVGEGLGPTLSGQFEGPRGIAVSTSCGIPGTDVYVPDLRAFKDPSSLVRAYGSPPDPAQCPPPERAPSINAAYGSDVGTEGATLAARINPHYWPHTSYHVEYGPDDCGSSSCQSTDSADLGTDVTNENVTGEISISDLEPGTRYHYRFVAESEGGGPTYGPDEIFTTFRKPERRTDCPNQKVRIGRSTNLPDCRAYELVSPQDKSGDAKINEGPMELARADGNAISYTSIRAFADPVASDFANQYIAQRDPDLGWQNRQINPPRSGSSFFTFGRISSHLQGMSDDFCSFFFLQDVDNPLTPGDNAGYADLYRRNTCDDPSGYELITSAGPQNPAPNGLPPGAQDSYWPKVQGFSTDGSKAFFRANAKLTSNASPAKGFQLYVNSNGSLRLVSVLPNGASATEQSSFGAFNHPFNSFLDYDMNLQHDRLEHAVSDDGSRVFWSTSTVINGPGYGKIYMRTNPDRSQSPVSGGVCTDPARACTMNISGLVTTGSALYWDASPDGSEVLISGVGSPADGNLYVIDTDTSTPHLIGSGTLGVVGGSEDLDTVYFASRDDLGGGGTTGRRNIYRWEKGTGLTFVVTLGGTSAGSAFFADRRTFEHDALLHSARVSADGERLVFASQANLTGADNAELHSADPTLQVFMFDATTDTLRCISCNGTGSRPIGSRTRQSGERAEETSSGFIRGWNYNLHASRSISADGDKVFFESYDRLAAADINGVGDVYEWQAGGAGECTQESPIWNEAADGCVSLLTSGKETHSSELIDASESGEDVFIRTRERLLPSDGDDNFDIYDVRVDGGFAEPVSTDLCEGDECQGPVAAPPPGSGPSTTNPGSGNPAQMTDCSSRQRTVKKAKKRLARAHGKKQKRKAKKRLRKAKSKLNRCRQGDNS